MTHTMVCDFCQGRTRKRRVRKHHWHNGRLYIVENVPAEVCQECGERYYHATTLDAIDELLDGEHPVKESLEVEVVSM
jgi:YgiT-type zinc finger domain-containing protein